MQIDASFTIIHLTFVHFSNCVVQYCLRNISIVNDDKMLPLVLLAIVVALLIAKIYSLQKLWTDLGVPHESYVSYLYTTLVRFRRENVFDLIHDYTKRYGRIYGTYQGLKPCLRVTTIDGVRDALVRNFSSIPRRGFDVPTGVSLWDKTLFVLSYKEWKHIRQVTGAAFTTAKLRGVTPRIVRLGNRMAKKFTDAAHSPGHRIDPKCLTQSFAIDVIAAVAYGLDLDATSDPNNPFVTHAMNIFVPSLGMFFLMFCPSLVRYLPFVEFPRKSSVEFFTKAVNAIIKDRRQKSGQQQKSGEVEQREEQDMLGLWLLEQQADPSFTDEIIASQIFLFFIAGLETIAYALYFSLYFLASNPEAQQRAFDEISPLLNELTEENAVNVDFGKLKFVEACILETLRLCPTDFVIDRITTEPCSVAGVPLKAGVSVQIPTPAMHRDPAYFPDPDLFKPERFLDGSSTLAAFMSFGDGPKICIGKRLSMLELTIALSCILAKVKLERCDETPPEPLEFMVGNPFAPYPTKPIIIGVTERC